MEAKWVSKDISDLFYCSNCNAKVWYWENYDFCPNCGAKITGYISVDEDDDPEEENNSKNFKNNT